jgi:hypothetical protein
LFASGSRCHYIAQARELLNAPAHNKPVMQMPSRRAMAPNRYRICARAAAVA